MGFLEDLFKSSYKKVEPKQDCTKLFTLSHPAFDGDLAWVTTCIAYYR